MQGVCANGATWVYIEGVSTCERSLPFRNEDMFLLPLRSEVSYGLPHQ